MAVAQHPIVRVTHRYPHSAETVFDAWLDRTRAGRFLFTTPTGRNVRVDIDPRAGGRYTIVDRRDGEDVSHEGVYLVIDRPRRLVFTLQVPKYSQTADKITIEIASLSAGCELTLTHDMTAGLEEYQQSAMDGWTTALNELDRLLEHS